jgi:hypothetical protein
MSPSGSRLGAQSESSLDDRAGGSGLLDKAEGSSVDGGMREMRSSVAVEARSAHALVAEGRYGVGMRVFSDRRLLRQIRNELVGNGMRAEEIAALENVTPDVLVALLEQRLATECDSGIPLRRFVASRPGFQVAAWRNTRKRSSKLHIIDPAGVALCGTPQGDVRSVVDCGPCLTCATRSGLVRASPAQAA